MTTKVDPKAMMEPLAEAGVERLYEHYEAGKPLHELLAELADGPAVGDVRAPIRLEAQYSETHR